MLDGVAVIGGESICPAGAVTQYTEAGTPTGREIEKHDQWYAIALSRSGKLLLGGDQTANDGVAVSFPAAWVRVTYENRRLPLGGAWLSILNTSSAQGRRRYAEK